MDLENGQRDVVDPEVRAYVSSLVTAVSQLYKPEVHLLTRSSLEEAVQTRMDDIYLVTMHWHVCET